MPALTIPSPTNTRSASPIDTAAQSEERNGERSRSQSPDRPPVSPLTPTTAAARLAPLEPSESQKHVLPPPATTFRQQPPSVPISESENPDAIALRSAISLLQLQREKSKRDLKTLQDLKTAAVSDPQGFSRSLQAQRKQASNSNVTADALTPTLSDPSSPAPTNDKRSDDARKDSVGVDAVSDSTQKFASIPQPQNIIRCPPVNWAKYHIVGEPLDKMHEEQKRYPGSSEPPRTHHGTKAPPHAVAAPYSPFMDGISESQTPQPQRGTKKSPS